MNEYIMSKIKDIQEYLIRNPQLWIGTFDLTWNITYNTYHFYRTLLEFKYNDISRNTYYEDNVHVFWENLKYIYTNIVYYPNIISIVGVIEDEMYQIARDEMLKHKYYPIPERIPNEYRSGSILSTGIGQVCESIRPLRL